jgi:hypothetical protein
MGVSKLMESLHKAVCDNTDGINAECEESKYCAYFKLKRYDKPAAVTLTENSTYNEIY